MKLENIHLGYSKAYGSLPPLPSEARSSKGTAWNCVGRPVPGIIFWWSEEGKIKVEIADSFCACVKSALDVQNYVH